MPLFPAKIPSRKNPEMFGPVQPTAYDLQFSLLGIPIRVLPWFWLAAVVLGFNSLQLGPQYLLAWIGVLFVSILWHELGHATVASLFGYPPHIVLYHFGGLAMYAPDARYSQARSILISFAGPVAGLLLGGVLYLSIPLLVRWGIVAAGAQGLSVSHFVIVQMLYVNIWWSLVNLLPVLPLDGGQICRDVCITINARQGQRWAIGIAIVTAAAVAFYAFRTGQTYIAILFGIMAAQNFEELQRRGSW